MKKPNKPYRQFVQSLGCLVRNKDCYGDIVSHHVKHKNAGWGDKFNLVPLCFMHHGMIHRIGKLTFQEKYGIDLQKIAESLYILWEQNALSK